MHGSLPGIPPPASRLRLSWADRNPHLSAGPPPERSGEPVFDSVRMHRWIFDLGDVAARPRVRGSDLITYLTESATVADRRDDRTLWEQAAKAIIPTLEYTQSLEASPIYSITRWIPPAGLRLATVIVLNAPGETGVEITYESV